jgi:hypothetical protein
MPKLRSPNYPNRNLEAALGFADVIYKKDGRNKISRLVLANHMQHESLTGPALSKIGALRAFGIIEGAGDELRVSEDAISALMAPLGSDARREAIRRLALSPTLFQDIRKEFVGKVSIESLTYWLIQNGFLPTAAPIAARTYFETMKFAGGLEPDIGTAVSSPAAKEVAPVATVPVATNQQGISVMDGERVAFTEELQPGNYLKLIASGTLNDFLLEALEDFVKRQRKRLEADARQVLYSGGSFVPVTGTYSITHHGHKGPATYSATKGDMFPLCSDCASDEWEVLYKLVS